ncbi:MAG: hypothetical protein ACRYGL_16695 [Janthinobacterium lividum]
MAASSAWKNFQPSAITGVGPVAPRCVHGIPPQITFALATVTLPTNKASEIKNPRLRTMYSLQYA